MALYFRDNIAGNTLFFADAAVSLVPVFSVDSVSPGPYYAGDTVTVQVSNANAAGKTISIAAGEFGIQSQDANEFTFVIPEPKTFGAKDTRYNTPTTFLVYDNGVTSTFQLSISPDVGHEYVDSLAVTGINASEYAPGLSANDNAYGYFVTGVGLSDLASGAVQSDDGATYRVWYQDETDGVWGSSADHIIDGSADTTIPVITLIGDSVVTHAHGTPYDIQGATATDNADGDITSDIVTTGAVNSNAVGSYVLSYNVMDASGNEALEVTRTVNVTDQAAPVMSLFGSSVVNLSLNQIYTEQGASAFDAVDGDLTDYVSLTSDVDTGTAGSYTVTYSATDAAGNTGSVGRTVNIAVDGTLPVISLVGSSLVTHAQGQSYSDAGATASDNADGNLTSSIVTTGASFDASTVGSYVIRYNVTDSAGNEAVEVTRTVNVTDQTIPVISLNGGDVALLQGAQYNDDGATASDNNDGDLTPSIIVGGDTVNTNTLGTYVITYDVTDSAGNAAVQVTRTVTVSTEIVVTILNDFIPRLLATDVHEVTVFKGRGNRFRVALSHDGEPIDLSQFTRFELYGLTDTPIDSDTTAGAIDWDDGNGVINIDAGDDSTQTGSVKTTLIAYSNEYASGVVLWHRELAQSHVTVNLIDA